MDYTKIPRSLIYVDKRNLEEFRVDDKDTLNGKLYDKIMDYTDIPTFDSAEKIVLDCFNNAYYTIMLILHTKRPELHLGAYIDAMKPYGGYHQTAQLADFTRLQTDQAVGAYLPRLFQRNRSGRRTARRFHQD